MKIAVFEAQQWEQAACVRMASTHEIACTEDALTDKSAGRFTDVEIISPFVHSRLDAGTLDAFPRLRLIATRSTGYDHIDIDYCMRRGVTVCNVPDYGDSTVAEHVFALLLGLARKIVEAVDRTRRGRFGQADLRGFELKGKTIGVIGAGRIGMRVIEIASAFGMDVIAVDVHADATLAKKRGFVYASLDEALMRADIITLHVPAGPSTLGLISDREFALMKPGAVLINTARGSVVDVEALVRALGDGRLSAVGLDVLPQEPAIRDEAEIFRTGVNLDTPALQALIANHALLSFPNVIVTPHNAYNTTEAVGRIIDTTIDNIEAFVQGEPKNVVTSQAPSPQGQDA